MHWLADAATTPSQRRRFDTSFGGARAANTKKIRKATGRRKADLVNRLSRTNKKAAKLVRPSIAATMRCSISVAGATRNQLKRIRSSMLGAAGVRYFARCPVVAFPIALVLDGGPAGG